MAMFNDILCPINLDSKDLGYLVKVVQTAAGLGKRIHFLYVNDEQAGYRHPVDREDAVALKVKEVVPSDLLAGLEVVYAASRGSLGEEIAAYCRDKNIDLIIAGHKHRGRFYSVLFDSPDVNIIDAVNVPVLLIPKG